MNRSFVLIGFVFFVFFLFTVFSVRAEELTCSLNGAVYTPKIANAGSSYLSLKVVNVQGKERSTSRLAYFVFSLFNSDGRKMSDMRLAYGCSNGVSVCRLTSYFGQYAPLNKLKSDNNAVIIDVIPLMRNYESAGDFLSQNKAPEAFIFPNTISAFALHEGMKSGGYIKFYEEGAGFPIISGKDVWVLSKCAE